MAAEQLTEPGARLVGDVIWIDPVDEAETTVGDDRQEDVPSEEEDAVDRASSTRDT